MWPHLEKVVNFIAGKDFSQNREQSRFQGDNLGRLHLTAGVAQLEMELLRGS
jgi:hypothetical protein